jgi:hypothetical protein
MQGSRGSSTLIEGAIIRKLSLPLNLEHNEHHPFHATLASLRQAARRYAT